MNKFFLFLMCLLFAIVANGQIFTFECVSKQLENDTCDVCPIINGLKSRSFNGLLIYRNGIPFKWIDEPYTARRFNNETVQFLEQIPNPDQIIIARFQTPFSTMQGFVDSTTCFSEVNESGGIDTVYNYNAVRNYDKKNKLLFVQDHYYSLSGIQYLVKGGLFRRVSSGVENGATILTGVYKWKRVDDSPIFPEFFVGLNDAKRIQSAVNLAGNYGYVSLNEKTTYILDDGIYLDSLQNFTIDGNKSMVKRCNSAKSATTITSVYSGGYSLTVSAIPESWEVGDVIVLAKGVKNSDISGRTQIASISGLTISLVYPIYEQIGGTFNAPIGTAVLEDFFLLRGRPSATEGVYGIEGANKNTIIKNVVFDGNKENNQIALGWSVNSAILLNGMGSQIYNCVFQNMSNEVGGGFGLNIHDNVFINNNGSVFHISGNDATLSESVTNTFSNNIVRNVNIVSRDTSGHNEGAISLSWNGGNVNIVNNYFENGYQQGIIGVITGNGVANDREEVLFVGNRCYNFHNIIYSLDASSKAFILTGNIFSNCGVNDYTPYSTRPFKICGNLIENGTTLIVPSPLGCTSNSELFGVGNLDDVIRWDGSKWVSSPDKWTNSVSGGNIYRNSNVGIGTGADVVSPSLQLAVGGGLGVVDNTGGSAMTPSATTLIGLGKYNAVPVNHAGAHIYFGQTSNLSNSGESFGSLYLQPATNGLQKNILLMTGNGTPTAKLIATQSGITMPTNSGTGDKLAYFDSGGGILRTGLPISSIPTVNGFATAIPFHTSVTALGVSTNLTWHGTGMSVAHSNVAEQSIDVSGGMQIRFPVSNPNTANSSVFLGVTNLLRTSSPAGAMIGYTGSYGVVPNRTLGTLVVQGRSDGGSGISFNTGSGGVERLFISENGPVEIINRLKVGSLTGTGASIGAWTSDGYATTATLGTGLSLSGGTLNSVGLGGTVTSVGLSMPSIFNVSGSPISGSGTLTATLTNQNANQVFAGPASGGAAQPTFRNLVALDITTGGGVAGTGTTNYHAKFTGTSTIGNSLIFDNGSSIGIGTTTLNGFMTIGKSTGVGVQKFIDLYDPVGYGSVYITRYNTASPLTMRGVRFGSDVGGYISSTTDSLMTIDGYNKSVGINCLNPAYPALLQINGVDDSRGLYMQRSATAKSKWRINSEGDVVFSSTSGNFAFADESGTSGNLAAYNPAVPLHLFAPAGVGTNGIFKIEKSGGYGATLFEQFYTNGSVYGCYVGNGTTRILTINEGTAKGLDIVGNLSVSSLTGTGTSIGAWTSGGFATTATLGTGLSLSGGTLSATGPTGSGTTNTVVKWTSSSTQGNSSMTDDGTTVTATSNLRVNAPGALTAEFMHGTANDVSLSIRNSASVSSSKSAAVTIGIGSALGGANGRYYELITQGVSTTAANLNFRYWNGTSFLTRATFSNDGTANFNNANGNLGLNTLGYFDLPTFAADPAATGYGKMWYNYAEGVNRVMVKTASATLRQVVTDQDDLIGTTVTKTANFTLAANEMYVVADANAGSFTVTFDGTMLEGRTYVLECRRNGTNTVTVDAGAGFNLVADTFSSFPDDGAIACGSAGTGFQAAYKTYIVRRFGSNIVIQ